MKNLVAGLLLALATIPAYAADFSICFDEPVAKRLYIDLEECSNERAKLTLCDQQKAVLFEEVKTREALAENIQAELDATAKAADTFKDAAGKANAKLQECHDEKPSRLTWASIGAAAVAVIYGAIKFLPLLAL